MSNGIISDIRKDYLYQLTLKGKRADDRSFNEYREIALEQGVIEKAEGSAWVQLGNTQVVVGVKIQPGEPYPDTPDRGVIITNAELVPLASPEFEPGPPNEVGIELARVVDRGVRESGCIDLEALCISPGEKVWIIFIDIHILIHRLQIQCIKIGLCISHILLSSTRQWLFWFNRTKCITTTTINNSLT